jgi:hypothetical protein
LPDTRADGKVAPKAAVGLTLVGRFKSVPKADISFVAGYLAVLKTFI